MVVTWEIFVTLKIMDFLERMEMIALFFVQLNVMKDGCYMGDFCYPKDNGLSGKNGDDCPVFCPAKCGEDGNGNPMMNCDGGYDYNGCPTPSFCIPTKGGP